MQFFKKWWFLLIIIITATGLRFYQLKHKMRFIWDEGRDMIAIRRIIVDRNLTLFGPYNEIDGKKDFFGVFHYYLMAPALLASNFDPIGPALFTAGLGLISVLLVYILSIQWISKKRALLTTWLYAISPLVVKYVQWPWNPNTTPFFALLFFLSLTKIIKQPQQSLFWSSLAGLCLGLLFQLHFFTIPLLFAFLITINSIKTNRSKVQGAVSFVGLAILPNLSFIIFDLTHEYFYLKIIKEMLFIKNGDSYLQLSLWNLFYQPLNYSIDLLEKLFALNRWLAMGLLGLLLIRIYQTLKQFFQKKKLSIATLFGISFLGFLAITAIFSKLTNDYHSAFIWFGVIFLLIEKIPLNRITWMLFALLSIIMLNGNQFNCLPDWSKNMPRVRALSLIITGDLKKDSGFKQNSKGEFNIAAFTDADTRATRYRYFLVKDGFQPSGIDQYANNQLIYIITPHDEETTKQNPAWEIQSVVNIPWQYLDTIEKVNVFKANLISHNK